MKITSVRHPRRYCRPQPPVTTACPQPPSQQHPHDAMKWNCPPRFWVLVKKRKNHGQETKRNDFSVRRCRATPRYGGVWYVPRGRRNLNNGFILISPGIVYRFFTEIVYFKTVHLNVKSSQSSQCCSIMLQGQLTLNVVKNHDKRLTLGFFCHLSLDCEKNVRTALLSCYHLFLYLFKAVYGRASFLWQVFMWQVFFGTRPYVLIVKFWYKLW